MDLTGFSVFREFVHNQIKDVDYILYVYDATSMESFNSIKLWKESLKEVMTNKSCVELLVGNKIDLERKIAVDETTLKNTAKGLKLEFFQVSAQQGKNIEELFTHIGNLCLKSYTEFSNKLKGICD